MADRNWWEIAGPTCDRACEESEMIRRVTQQWQTAENVWIDEDFTSLCEEPEVLCGHVNALQE